MRTKKMVSLLLTLALLFGTLPTTVFAEGEECQHAGAVYSDEFANVEATCFEPGVSGYYYCEECGYYLDESKENKYWEPLLAAKIPATGHYFNTDTGVCDDCGLGNPVYTKVTSLADVNEEDLYIIVAEVEVEEGTKYFVLGGLEENKPDEQGNVWCPVGGKNAIEVTADSDGSISLVNQEILEDGRPSEFMLDVNPEQFGSMTELGLTTVMLKLPNYCVYSFQSYSFDNNGYMGVPRYGNGEYGRWDGSEWVIDFYTTVVTDDTYRYEDEFGSKTHAEQVADGNIGEYITEGNLLLYRAPFYSLGGAMFTLRLRNYNDQYYFIAGEDGPLEGAGEWDSETDTTPTNDTQYAVWLYRCDVPASSGGDDSGDGGDDVHSHVWGKWEEVDGTNHKRVCSADGCPLENSTETGTHNWNDGEETKAPTCTEAGVKTYTCSDCGAAKTEPVPALDHAWGDWTDDVENDKHSRTCSRENCTVGTETGSHEWDDWAQDGESNHKKVCSVCKAERTAEHEWTENVVQAPNCGIAGQKRYICSVETCNYEKFEDIPALEHEWGKWTKADEADHARTCANPECPDQTEKAPHTSEEKWISIGGTSHERVCSECANAYSAPHNWGEGVVTKQATTTETGVKTYTCSDCGAAKTEIIPKIVCDHSWGKWSADDDATHTHTCINGSGCTAFQRQEHEWNAGVVTAEPTESAEGVITYTCLVCSHEKEEAIPMLQHNHRFGRWTDNGDGTHTRRCGSSDTCTASETETHSCDAWVNSGDGTHSGECAACTAPMSEEHIWSDWAVGTTESVLIRSCKCGASEEMTVQQPIESAVVDITAPESNSAAAALVVDNAVTLFNDVLTTEEQTAVAAGETTVSVYLEVTDIPVNDVFSSDKAAAAAAIEKADAGSDENTEIGMYLDINLFKEITTTDEETSNTQTQSSQVSKTSNEVTITIRIPEELISSDSSVERTYRIVRVHEDESGNLVTDVIEGIFDPEEKTFTFKTDKFSTYALAYSDTPVTTYTVTYTDGVDGTEVFADQKFTVNEGDATPAFEGTPSRSGYTFKGWSPAVAETVSENATYTAKWEKKSSGGDGSGSSGGNSSGGSSTVAPKPEKPKEEEKPAPTVTFTDVPAGEYYSDAVVWAVEKGITEGVGGDSFAPEASCTRGQMVTFLYRMAGEPATNGVVNFTDVSAGDYYARAVAWAVEKGITNGTGDGKFSPDAECSRAQMATLLWRMVGAGSEGGSGFADVDAGAYYADAVAWAVANGITNGTGDGNFSPNANCTRGQMVTFLYRCFAK